MKPTDETWHLWSYEGPSNGGKKDRHGASVCSFPTDRALSFEERDAKHECLMTVTSAESEQHAVARGRLAAAAPELYRALEAYVNSGSSPGNHHEWTSIRGGAIAALKKAMGEK